MEILWNALARDDITEIFLYIAQDNPTNAKKEIEYLYGRIDHLANMPMLGRKTEWQNVRVVVTATYLIPYRIEGEYIQILRIHHTSRPDFPEALEQAL